MREFRGVKSTGTGGEASESSRKLCARSRGSSRVANSNGTSTGSLIPPPTPGGQLNGQKSTLRSVKVGGTFGLTGLRTFSAKIYRPVGICRDGLAKGRAYNRKLNGWDMAADTVGVARNSRRKRNIQMLRFKIGLGGSWFESSGKEVRILIEDWCICLRIFKYKYK